MTVYKSFSFSMKATKPRRTIQPLFRDETLSQQLKRKKREDQKQAKIYKAWINEP